MDTLNSKNDTLSEATEEEKSSTSLAKKHLNKPVYLVIFLILAVIASTSFYFFHRTKISSTSTKKNILVKVPEIPDPGPGKKVIKGKFTLSDTVCKSVTVSTSTIGSKPLDDIN